MFAKESTPHLDPKQALRLVSRTFALSIEQLPGLLRDAITVAYLMFRVSDFLEDNEVMPAERKVELLNLWVSVLNEDVPPERLTGLLSDVDPDDPEAAVAKHADEVLAHLKKLPPEVQGFIRKEVAESSLGMARWQARGPVVHDEADLDDYMFEVAGRVGHMLTHIFAWRYRPLAALQDELMPMAREFGMALQTVNVIRGLRKDYERGWIYVPESFCAAVNLSRADLFKPEYEIQALQVVDIIADKAERHLNLALKYVKALPRWLHTLRLACIWPMLFAVRTLALSRHNVNVLVGEVKMTRDEVKAIVRDTTLFGWSNSWLDSYYHHLQTPPDRKSTRLNSSHQL